MLVFPGLGLKAEAAEAKNGNTFRSSEEHINVSGKARNVNRIFTWAEGRVPD